MEPNKERLRLWVAALRSGEFPQGKDVLCRVSPAGDTYCCLGVACEVAIANGLDIGTATRRWAKRYDNEDLILPQVVADWYGLGSRDPMLIHGESRDIASIWNDSARLDFEEIAKAIEFTFDLEGDAGDR